MGGTIENDLIKLIANAIPLLQLAKSVESLSVSAAAAILLHALFCSGGQAVATHHG